MAREQSIGISLVSPFPGDSQGHYPHSTLFRDRQGSGFLPVLVLFALQRRDYLASGVPVLC